MRLPPNVPTTSEVTVWLNEGEPIEYLAVSAPNEWFKFGGKVDKRYEHFKAYGVGLQWFEMEGPLDEAWPLKSHDILLGNMPLEPAKEQSNGLDYRVVTDDPLNDARRLLRRFAERCYRRPVEDQDIQIAMKMVRPRLRRVLTDGVTHSSHG